MNNLVVMPLIIPLITGLVLVIFRRQIRLHRLMSLLATLSVSVVAILLMNQVVIDGPQTLQLGNWEAPFGISLVADMLSGILVLVTGIVVSCCLLYAFFSIGRDRELNYFYPLVLFLLTGINGSFLTGDIFNLFVCFEVMLVASYVLISLGGTKLQLRESFKYILVNLISSFLFLVSIAYLYGMLGTLNMAHLSVRVAEAGQVGLLIPVAILFLIVFSIKAGLLLFYWLPGSYSAPPTVVGAVFASLLTKVGAYAIIRVFSLIFHHDPQITYLLIGILAGLTMLLGAIGAVAYWDIKRILTYNVIISIGLILAGFASFNYAGLTGSVYYLIHDMVVKALIFLAGGEKAFELLRLALLAEQKVAIGRSVMGTKDTLMAIIPREDGILISTMFYADDVKELQKPYTKPEVSEEELKMAKLLINSMDTPFDPSQYKDEYQEKLRQLIETKISGKEVVAAEPESTGKVIDLMDALKASVEKAKKDKETA
jgi:multicomponent Na+:H+ antiporter subunit D